ncbi:hypothetical protein BT67DRAFT_374537 [Trichocladium antarcticum]|uniref:Wax synthase domain-containing protein n=1 Tax=Trichocladium antarcticum TaxID=1450529 RepID=A0AAN6ZFX4_9PEZI|nr:hypothetical protein BT67DRAFT_374537 [Trichocladium antarcticum]
MAANPRGGDQNISPGAFYQQEYRDIFHAAVAAGRVTPAVFPWSLVGSFFLPLLYLSIPHTKRPWLYRMRWAVAAAIVALNARMMQTTSAANAAVAYAVGLVAAWGTLWSLRLVLFTRPQWDAARVERRPRRCPKEPPATGTGAAAPDESVAAALAHYEYFWQPFPSEAPFLARLGWAANLMTSFRGAGWNHAISAIPHPPFHAADTTVPLHLTPLASRTGVTRSTTYAAFLRARLQTIALAWLAIDLLTLTLRQDPYFLLGPDHTHHTHHTHHHHPPHSHHTPLALPLPALTTPLLRNTAALTAILAGLHLYAALAQLVAVALLRPALLGPRADLWQHPTLFGSLAAGVADRGLRGFWGGWWHQTLRAGLVAPARWLLLPASASAPAPARRKRAMVVTVVTAFVLSGLLHAAGGYTAVAARPGRGGRSWTPVVFFGLQAVGVLVQAGGAAVLGRVPRGWRRAGNVLFVAVWLQLTGWGLVDDMSRAGVWLFEPVPVSPLRWMGLGLPGESWWRWDGGCGPRWYTGRHWWESGIRL